MKIKFLFRLALVFGGLGLFLLPGMLLAADQPIDLGDVLRGIERRVPELKASSISTGAVLGADVWQGEDNGMASFGSNMQVAIAHYASAGEAQEAVEKNLSLRQVAPDPVENYKGTVLYRFKRYGPVICQSGPYAIEIDPFSTNAMALVMNVLDAILDELDHGQTNSNAEWLTFTDAARHFHFHYPAAWKIDMDGIPVMHYRNVFVALNSAERHTVGELEVSTNTFEYGVPTTIKQLPAGTAYMDIGCWDGPWPRFGPNIHEMEAADLSTLLKTNDEKKADGLTTRQIEFHKWGRFWSIIVYMRPPMSQENRQLIEYALESFRFDGVPSGDEIWAIGLARRKLPPEADPHQFTREGGSSVYYNATLRDGNDVLVMFTKHLKGQPEQTWSYRVTQTGDVRPLDGQVLMLNDSSHYHGAMKEIIPQFEDAQPIGTIPEPVTSLFQGLLEVRKVANRPIVAITEYANWFWYSPDGFISGYAVQKGGNKIFKWSDWSH
jgi:hypothetical protein